MRRVLRASLTVFLLADHEPIERPIIPGRNSWGEMDATPTIASGLPTIRELGLCRGHKGVTASCQYDSWLALRNSRNSLRNRRRCFLHMPPFSTNTLLTLPESAVSKYFKGLVLAQRQNGDRKLSPYFLDPSQRIYLDAAVAMWPAGLQSEKSFSYNKRIMD